MWKLTLLPNIKTTLTIKPSGKQIYIKWSKLGLFTGAMIMCCTGMTMENIRDFQWCFNKILPMRFWPIKLHAVTYPLPPAWGSKLSANGVMRNRVDKKRLGFDEAGSTKTKGERETILSATGRPWKPPPAKTSSHRADWCRHRNDGLHQTPITKRRVA